LDGFRIEALDGSNAGEQLCVVSTRRSLFQSGQDLLAGGPLALPPASFERWRSLRLWPYLRGSQVYVLITRMKRYYSPRPDRDLITQLYYGARARGLPMTVLASTLVRAALRRGHPKVSAAGKSAAAAA
jgi:hypothetical protein